VRVAAVDLVPYAIPFREPLSTSHGTLTRRRGAILRLRTDRGPGGSILEGIGDFAPHPAAPDSVVDGEWKRLRAAVVVLEGLDLDGVDAALADLRSLPPAARSATVMALLDLKSRSAGRLLRDEIGPGRRDEVEASELLAGDTVGAAREAWRRGFRAVKVKAAADVDATVEKVRSLSLALPEIEIRVDANGGWSRVEACRAARALAGLRGWIEQPVERDDVEGLALVRGMGGSRVAADESVADVESTARILAAGAADVVVLKLAQVGGPLDAARAAGLAREAGVDAVVTTGIDAGVATAAALHLAASLHEAPPPCGLATAGWLVTDLLREPLDSGPRMRLPSLPGIGVRIDEGALERHRVERP
jgi:o-succinylbenzoate synthase